MEEYLNINSLSHIKNFIDEGGLRVRNINKDIDSSIPKISIITVVKNSESSIEKTINSVLTQSYKNLEYIVIDGNSKDSTLNKLKKFENKIDYWCSIIDDGIYDAMNFGLKLAKGDIIGIINSGDIYTENSLKIVGDYFIKNSNLQFLFGTVKRHYLKNNIILKSGYNKKRIKYNFDSVTCHSSGFFIKSSLQKKIGAYNLKYKCSSDYDLFYKLLSIDGLKGAATSENELIGMVESGGFSSKFGFWNRLIEEMKIRLDNGQNIFLVIIIFFNAIFKNYLKKIL